jgi:hypothetical protein
MRNNIGRINNAGGHHSNNNSLVLPKLDNSLGGGRAKQQEMSAIYSRASQIYSPRSGVEKRLKNPNRIGSLSKNRSNFEGIKE